LDCRTVTKQRAESDGLFRRFPPANSLV
jgi:hypothetical protein